MSALTLQSMSKMGPFADFGVRHLEARLIPQADIVSLATDVG
jgi:hypothetical protein